MAPDDIAFLPHPRPLLEGRLVGRYDRFIADVRLLSGEVVKTHCVNPGRMEGMVRPGARVWISPAPPERKRKLRYTWELMDLDGVLVGANTTVPNAIARAAVESRRLRGLSRWDELVPERRYGGGSRVDLWLRRGRQEHYVEVKNCHLVYPDGHGYFPDSVSDRARRHLEELMAVVEGGARATVLFTLQDPRGDCVRPSDAHDPSFAATLREARRRGVRLRAIRVVPTLDGYRVTETVPVDTRPYAIDRRRAWRRARDATSGWKRRGPVED